MNTLLAKKWNGSRGYHHIGYSSELTKHLSEKMLQPIVMGEGVGKSMELSYSTILYIHEL